MVLTARSAREIVTLGEAVLDLPMTQSRWSSRFADEVASSRATLAQAWGLLETVPADRFFKRDKDGKFAGGAGGGSDAEVPAPHRARDLIAEGHADAIAQSATAAAAKMPNPEGSTGLAGRLLYRGGGVGPHGDEALHYIAAQQGFEGKATTVSRADMDARVAHGDTEMFRGVRPRDGRTPEQMHEQVRSGEAYHGLGFAGNGSYMSASHGEAGRYGTVGRYALHRDARVIDFHDLQQEQKRFIASVGGQFTPTGRVFFDPGRYAAARGYDAIRWKRGDVGGGLHTGEPDEFIILNRTALLAEVP